MVIWKRKCENYNKYELVNVNKKDRVKIETWRKNKIVEWNIKHALWVSNKAHLKRRELDKKDA